MKEFKITEEQIKENKDLTLKEYFKEVFEETHKIGFWYKHPNCSLFNVTSIDEFGALYGYGFFDSKYKEYSIEENTGFCACNSVAKFKLILATEEEVFNALKKEVEKRYKVGQTVKCLLNEEIESINEIDYIFWFDSNEFWIHGDCKIFDNGKWAEIISQPDEVIELNGVKYKRID